jgi:HEAT repeat protein
MADQQTLVSTIRRREGDNDVRGVAITLCGLRRHKDAFPALLEALRDPEAEIRDKAIGALIELGDRRAVKALASSAAFSDTFELGKILEAVAALGGDEARSYLGFVASGHQDPRIREEAKVALGHLEQRESRDGPSKAPTAPP